MPDTVECVQGRNVRRCTITATTATTFRDLVITALNAQRAERGTAISRNIIGFRIVTASAAFTVSNPDGTGSLTILAAPYDCPAVNAMDDTLVGGGATLGVEVFFNGVDSDIP